MKKLILLSILILSTFCYSQEKFKTSFIAATNTDNIKLNIDWSITDSTVTSIILDENILKIYKEKGLENTAIFSVKKISESNFRNNKNVIYKCEIGDIIIRFTIQKINENYTVYYNQIDNFTKEIVKITYYNKL